MLFFGFLPQPVRGARAGLREVWDIEFLPEAWKPCNQTPGWIRKQVYPMTAHYGRFWTSKNSLVGNKQNTKIFPNFLWAGIVFLPDFSSLCACLLKCWYTGPMCDTWLSRRPASSCQGQEVVEHTQLWELDFSLVSKMWTRSQSQGVWSKSMSVCCQVGFGTSEHVEW
jgi:hypothetical protein